MDSESHAIVSLERRRCEAVASGDVAALQDLLADDYLHVLASGVVLDKAQYVALVSTSPHRSVRGKLEVRRYGTAAVIVGDLSSNNGAGDEVRYYCTEVAHGQDGRWQLVSCIMTQRDS